MPLAPPVTDLESLKIRSAVSKLMEWNPAAVKGGKFDRGELTIEIDRTLIREAVQFCRETFGYNYLSDLTCVDLHPVEPRFEVVYHLLSHAKKERLRLKVRLTGEDANVESLVPLFPGANFFEREIFDLFGVRFIGHPHMKRIMMPDDWEGHPLRKDYPVEGYR